MKTFEGYDKIERSSVRDDRKLIFPMYFLRAVAVALILLLLFYMAERLLVIYGGPTFPDFIIGNYLTALFLLAVLFIGQLFFYEYRLRRSIQIRRSVWEIIVGYALPIIGIIAVVYTAYAVGVM